MPSTSETTPDAIVTLDQLYDELMKIVRELDGSSSERHIDFPTRSCGSQVRDAKRLLGDDFLKRLPFGELLIQAVEAPWREIPAETKSKNPRKQKVPTRTHICYTLRAMHKLITKPADLIHDNHNAQQEYQDKVPGAQRAYRPQQAVNIHDVGSALQTAVNTSILGTAGYAHEAHHDTEHIKKLLMVAALYHDIGKSISSDRHPFEGYHLLHEWAKVKPRNENDKADKGKADKAKDDKAKDDKAKDDKEINGPQHRKWLAGILAPEPGVEAAASAQGKKAREADWQLTDEEARWYDLFIRLIRCHDDFGVVGTGEGSQAIFLDAIAPYETDPEYHYAFFSYLLLLTMADIDAALREFKPGEQEERVDDHPPTMKGGVDIWKVDNLLTDWKYLCEQIEEAEGDPVQLATLLLEDAQVSTRTQERIRRLLVTIEWPCQSSIVVAAIKQVCGGEYLQFCRDLGIIAKLDYALKFLKKLSETARDDPKKIQPEDFAIIMVRILDRLVRTYAGFTETARQRQRPLGIELSWLTRDDKVRDKIIRLLLTNPILAMTWLDDEVSAFTCTM